MERYHAKNPLDPLLSELILFESKSDLIRKIEELFEFLDVDESGGLTIDELCEGFGKLAFQPRIHLSPEDLENFFEHHKTVQRISKEGQGLVTKEKLQGLVTKEQFEFVMRRQLHLYTLRQMGQATALSKEMHGELFRFVLACMSCIYIDCLRMYVQEWVCCLWR